MGQCTGRSARTQEIDRILQNDKKEQQKNPKVLLLGIGESGKSTIFKQFKIVQDSQPDSGIKGFTDEEKRSFIPAIHSQCVTQMRVLTFHAERLGFNVSKEAGKALDLLNQKYPGDSITLNKEIADIVQLLWNDDGIQKTYALRGREFLLNDCADHFFANVHKFIQPNYLPDNNDILRARIRSVGIEEAQFKFLNIKIRVTDVGGQRSERRKWISCFTDVTAIIFVASLSCYDQVLREDENKNAMEETFQLFEEITKHPDLLNPHIILFLNKTDLFDAKCLTSPLNSCGLFDFEGDKPEDYRNYIREVFESKAGENGRKVFTHFTCAINTDNVQKAAAFMRLILLNGNLQETALPGL